MQAKQEMQMAGTLFSFNIGDPGPNADGRWLKGSIEREAERAAYTFIADLMFRPGFNNAVLVCNRVALRVTRPFSAWDFWAFVEVLTMGRFSVTDRKRLFECPREVHDDLWHALNHAAVQRHLSPQAPGAELAEDLTALQEQLQNVRKREFLYLALSRSRV
jgi:hypothetical protein